MGVVGGAYRSGGAHRCEGVGAAGEELLPVDQQDAHVVLALLLLDRARGHMTR